MKLLSQFASFHPFEWLKFIYDSYPLLKHFKSSRCLLFLHSYTNFSNLNSFLLPFKQPIWPTQWLSEMESYKWYFPIFLAFLLSSLSHFTLPWKAESGCQEWHIGDWNEWEKEWIAISLILRTFMGSVANMEG